MGAFFATMAKELRLLGRDRAGLLVLFLMPTILVLVVSLVQDNVLEATGAGGLKVLYLDRDGGELGKRIGEELAAAGLIMERPDSAEPEDIRLAVAGGKYTFGIVVPPGAGEALRAGARRLAEAALARGGEEPPVAEAAAELQVFFDPTVQGSLRTAVTSSLRLAALGLETEEKLHRLSEILSANMHASSSPQSLGTDNGTGEIFTLRPGWGDEALLPVLSLAASPGELQRLPTAVQQNVPAWTLFGMFFIVVPLAGTLLRERQEGTLIRLRTLPVSPLALLAGKIAAYVLVCMVQFALMLLMGMLVLPFFGTSSLEIGHAPGAVLLLAFCAALAATGFGILVGTLAGSYEQASMAGAVSVVIAAALGGVMVPVYVMPAAMRSISAFSPLAWGLNGFLDLFVRGGDLGSILPNAFALLSFFAATLALAWGLFRLRCRQGA